MNTDRSEVYRLEGLDAENGQLLDKELIEKVSASADQARALEAIKRGENVVAVADEVAHTQLVGQRELERRKRRRRSGGVVGS